MKITEVLLLKILTKDVVIFWTAESVEYIIVAGIRIGHVYDLLVIDSDRDLQTI